VAISVLAAGGHFIDFTALAVKGSLFFEIAKAQHNRERSR